MSAHPIQKTQARTIGGILEYSKQIRKTKPGVIKEIVKENQNTFKRDSADLIEYERNPTEPIQPYKNFGRPTFHVLRKE